MGGQERARRRGGLQLEPRLQGTFTLMEYPENSGCFCASGLSTRPHKESTRHIYLLSERGPCYLDRRSKLVLHNESKFGIFGVWVGFFFLFSCGARDETWGLCMLHKHSTTDLRFQPDLKYLKSQEHFPLGSKKVKVFAAEPDYVSLSPMIHMVEGEN